MFVRVASAVAAQELLEAVGQRCQVWSFSPRFEEFRDISGGIQFESGEF